MIVQKEIVVGNEKWALELKTFKNAPLGRRIFLNVRSLSDRYRSMSLYDRFGRFQVWEAFTDSPIAIYDSLFDTKIHILKYLLHENV